MEEARDGVEKTKLALVETVSLDTERSDTDWVRDTEASCEDPVECDGARRDTAGGSAVSCKRYCSAGDGCAELAAEADISGATKQEDNRFEHRSESAGDGYSSSATSGLVGGDVIKVLAVQSDASVSDLNEERTDSRGVAKRGISGAL